MKETFIKCTCDYCKSEMFEYEYDRATKIIIRVDVPNQKGGAGECNGVAMSICNKCSEELGIVNSEIHNGLIGDRERIKTALEKCKTKILDMFVNKK